jgi:hypothetical protein
MTVKKKKLIKPHNCACWAVGLGFGESFYVRRVVWGLLHAQHECRENEQIRAAKIVVEPVFKKRKSLIAEPLRENEGLSVTS